MLAAAMMAIVLTATEGSIVATAMPTIVVAIGWIAPAPAPWRARKKISDPIPQAKPHNSEAARNRLAPAKNTGLRPY